MGLVLGFLWGFLSLGRIRGLGLGVLVLGGRIFCLAGMISNSMQLLVTCYSLYMPNPPKYTLSDTPPPKPPKPNKPSPYKTKTSAYHNH